MTSKRRCNALSAVFVQSVQEMGTYSDGGGLNLRVEDSGTKYWFQLVSIDGKRRNLGLGGYPTVSLAEARKAALVNARMIREGRDPLAEKREAIAARQRPPTTTFAEAADIVVEIRRPMDQYAHYLCSPRHWEQAGFRHHQRGRSGRPLADLDEEARDDQSGAPAVRNGSGLGCPQGYRTDNPTTRSITKVLPKTPRIKQHYPALHYRDVPPALEKVRASTADTVTS